MPKVHLSAAGLHAWH